MKFKRGDELKVRVQKSSRFFYADDVSVKDV